MKNNKPLAHTKTTSPSDNKISEIQDKLARSLADYANLEKRIERDRQLFVTLSTVSIISKMITVLDDLYLAYEHLKDEGLKLTIDKFLAVLQSEGLEEIKSHDLPFDPATMECIGSAEGKENIVIDVKKIGYSLNGQVIRPAQVIVGKTQEIIN